MRILHEKLKRMKQELRRFNQTQYGNIGTKVTEKRKELAEVQVAVLQGPNNRSLVKKEKVLQQELHELMKAEESYYKQKSRIN